MIEKEHEVVVNKMFERCFSDKAYKQAIGIAIESRRLEVLKRAILMSEEDLDETLAYVHQVTHDTITIKEYRREILELLIEIYQAKSSDYFNLTNCQFFINDPEATAVLLTKLLESDDDTLKAY